MGVSINEQSVARTDEPDVADSVLLEELRRLVAENVDLHRALVSRAVIDKALGMVMAIGRCPEERAWRLLVQVSQHSNTKLREVAAALVATSDGRPLPDSLRRPFRQAIHEVSTER